MIKPWLMDAKQYKVGLLFIAIGLTACSPSEQALPSRPTNLVDTASSTPVLLIPSKTPSPTIVLTDTLTAEPTATQFFTQAPLTQTSQPVAVIELTPTTCLETFCPPPWLDQISKLLLDQPGILEAMALDELVVRIVYNPEELGEEEVIELFVQLTNLEVEP